VDHVLARLLKDAALGQFPAIDGGLSLVPAIDGTAAGVVAFSGHTVIATDLAEDEVRRRLQSSDPGAPMHPAFLTWLAERVGARLYTPDGLFAADRCDVDVTFKLVRRDDLEENPRVRLARMLRREVLVFSDMNGRGLITVGRGVLGRQEVSVEVQPRERGRGLGRRLAQAARALVPHNEPLFAQISPGNAASVRAFLAAGYKPIGSEVWMVRSNG